MKKGRRRKVDRSSMFGSSKNTPTTTCSSYSIGTGTTFSSSGSSQAFSFSAAPSSGTGGLFSTSTPVGFGQPQNAQSLLGGTPSTSLFGQPVLNGQNSAGIFGSRASTCTTTASSTFGIGTTFTNSKSDQPLGTQGSEGTGSFGAAPFPGLFESTNTQKFSSYSHGTTVKFSAVSGTDSMVKNGITTTITVRHQCITVMSNYDKKSFEELRVEDYSRQGRASTTADGTAGSFSLFKPVLDGTVIEQKNKDTVNEQVHEDTVNKQEHEDGPKPQAEVKSSEEPSEYEKALEKRKKYICVEHDEALKVYCHTDNCLICLVCQVYGKHAGHKCELVTNMATTTREELFSETKKLDDHFELIKKSRRKLEDRKDSILQTLCFLQDRVAKHMTLLRACLNSGEKALKSEIDVKANEKIASLDAQDRVMANVEEKCDLAYSLIEKCRRNDKTLVEEKPNIFKLIEEVSSFIQKCELEPAETDNLSCYFEYDLFDKLKTQIGGVKVLKPGQKEGSIYGFNEQEMWEEGKTKDAEVQTDQESTELAHSEISLQGLDEAADVVVMAHILENSPALVDPNVDEKRDLDCNGNKNDNDDENKVELEKMVEGQTSYPVGPNLLISRDLQSSSEVVIGLQEQILEKVDRLAVADGDDDSDSAKEIESDD